MKIHTREKSFGPVASILLARPIFGKVFYSVRLYAVDGVAFDTGQSRCRAEADRFVGAQSVQTILMTHHHEDHSGNGRFFKDRRGMRLLGHPAFARFSREGIDIPFYRGAVWGDAETYDVDPVGASFETGRYRFEAIHTPGHSDDHLVYFERNNGWLFSGDLYIASKIKIFRFDEDFTQALDSLEQVARLDFDCLFCAHNPKPKGGKTAIDEKIDWFRGLNEKVTSLHHQGYPDKTIRDRVLGREEAFSYVSRFQFSKLNLVRSILKGCPTAKP